MVLKVDTILVTYKVGLEKAARLWVRLLLVLLLACSKSAQWASSLLTSVAA